MPSENENRKKGMGDKMRGIMIIKEELKKVQLRI
jgi:hypothetical protein